MKLAGLMLYTNQLAFTQPRLVCCRPRPPYRGLIARLDLAQAQFIAFDTNQSDLTFVIGNQIISITQVNTRGVRFCPNMRLRFPRIPIPQSSLPSPQDHCATASLKDVDL